VEGNGTMLAAQLPNLLAGLAYVNFRTVQFPAGEIRGQLPMPILGAHPCLCHWPRRDGTARMAQETAGCTRGLITPRLSTAPTTPENFTPRSLTKPSLASSAARHATNVRRTPAQ
jgi:hypothetical protein